MVVYKLREIKRMRNKEAYKELQEKRVSLYTRASNLESRFGREASRLAYIYRELDKVDSAIASLTKKIN